MSQKRIVLVVTVLLGLLMMASYSHRILAQEGAKRLDSNPVWSPDGTRIAFLSISLDDYLAGINKGADEYNDDIWVMNADGTDRVNLTSGSSRVDGNPVWSPDGTRIAFVSKRSGNSDLWVMGADGSNPTNLTLQDLRDNYDPLWSPDGRWIAYLAENIKLVSYDIWLVEPDGTHPRQLTPWENHFYASMAWSPDSRAIVSAVEEIDPNVKSAEEIFHSPDQSHPGGLWIMAIDGGEPIKITPDRRYRDVTWCPCGTVLAATMGAGLGSEIWLLPVDGSQPVDLANVTPDLDYFPVWSPDGGQIAFESRRPGFALSRDIWIMKADGSEPANLTADFAFVNYEPSWSPDGSHIAFTSQPAGSTQIGNMHYDFDLDADIWIMNADGSNKADLTGTTGQ